MMQAFIYKIKKNPYQFFFFKLAVLLLIVFIMDFAIGSLLSKYYFKLNRGDYYRTTYSMDSTKADVLIFGSSRANHHYNPELIEKRLGMSCYNAGRDGNSIFYHTAVLKTILKRYTPKIVILDIQPEELAESQDSYDKLVSLLPYYKNYPEVRPLVELRSPFEKYKMISRIYPYNSLVSIIASGSTKNKVRDDVNGYLPLNKTWNEPIKEEHITKYVSDKNKVKYFETFIKDCKDAGILLYIVISPKFVKPGKQFFSIPEEKQIAQNNAVKFYDYSQDPLFIDDISLFADIAHLNANGAALFTNMIIDRIKNDK